MPSRKLGKSRWMVEGHRRSPRISALEACKNTGSSTSATATSISAQQMKRLFSNDQAPSFRTRARKKRKLTPVQEVDAATPSRPPNQGQVETSLKDHQKYYTDERVVQGEDWLKPGVYAASTDQPSNESPVWLPEKRILERVLDILQRRDTYEIFAEPVDPNEVEDYYEIIEEPMDFGTMRAKLHEGMYTNFEQFEHDAFLITENAMHFNSTGSIYFRQARAIHELAKNVFHILRTCPQNFELEFSETRQRSGRRAQGETGRRSRIKTGGNHNTNGREHRVLSGTQDGRRSRSFESDPRSTYRPCASFLNENDSTGLTLSSDIRQLEHVNQHEIGYTESLMSFVKDSGPIAQKIARKKLLQCFEMQKTQLPLASSSSLRPPSTLSNVFTSPLSQNFQDNLNAPPIFMKITADSLHSWKADMEEKGCLGDERGIQSSTVSLASSSGFTNSHGTLGGKVHSSEFHQNRIKETRFGSSSSNAHAAENSTPVILNQWKPVKQSKSLESFSQHSQSNMLEPRLRNIMGFSSFSQTKNSLHNLNSLHLSGDDDQRGQPSDQNRTPFETNQVPKPNQAKAMARPYTFDLPYLRAQLGKINSSGQDGFLQTAL